MHERGSHGASGSTVLVVGWNRPLLPEEELEVVGVVVAADPAPVLPAADVGVTVAGGGLTLNWVPGHRRHRDPGCTCVGSMAMITAPLIEFATAWAAARFACDFDE